MAHGAHGPSDIISLSAGTTAVIVSGLAGNGRRIFVADSHLDDSWWASIYALEYQVTSGQHSGSETDIADGALFIDFHVDGDGQLARGYFKTTTGQVIDRFELVASER